uniref:Uncharacterized protein n=1 Tax=Mycobacterium riyadhense TaxID=486698 RepID=A0A653F1Z5_9MYCO|nr:hypothetical protein BIN_B_05262 [Mycobacterium riyadhense]
MPGASSVVNVNQHELARIFRRRAAQQSIRGRGSHIRCLPLGYGHCCLGDKHQPGLHQFGVTEPGLQHPQRAMQPTSRPIGKRSRTGDRRGGQHHLRGAGTGTDRLDQSHQVRETLNILGEDIG